ncbi:SoxR reducing system RseC family protein [Bacteroidota bacterium]
MNVEELVEEGIVVRAKNGEIDIELIKSDECEHCSAKLICKPKDDNSNLLHIKDSIHVIPGDKVKIVVKGSALFKASLFLYGLPLILLIVGIFIGMSVFDESSMVELLSFSLSVLVLALYYLSLFFIPGLREKIEEKPRIIRG